MFFENTLFFILKNRIQKTVFWLSNLISCFLILENGKLFSKTIIKQILTVLKNNYQRGP